MKVLHTLVTELIGLLVDDWAFAGLILVWIGLFALLRPLLGLQAGPALFAGLAILVLSFVVRKARQ